MKRGEIWIGAGRGEYSGKPRPLVILQDNRFDATNSITICPFTTDPTDLPLLRPVVEPSAENGLIEVSRVMVEKITTVRRERLTRRVGMLGAEEMARIERMIVVFLGIRTR